MKPRTKDGRTIDIEKAMAHHKRIGKIFGDLGFSAPENTDALQVALDQIADEMTAMAEAMCMKPPPSMAGAPQVKR